MLALMELVLKAQRKHQPQCTSQGVSWIQFCVSSSRAGHRLLHAQSQLSHVAEDGIAYLWWAVSVEASTGNYGFM